MKILETQRLILRQWRPSDYEPFVDLNKDAETMAFFPAPIERDQTIAQIERIMAHIDQYGYGFFALERKDNKEFIGFTGLSHPRFESYFTPCVEIGWRLSKVNWGHGFATEAAMACLDYAFDRLRLGDIYSFTSVHNKRSINVMERIGMKMAGVFDHPSVDQGHFIRQHVLYKITSPDVYKEELLEVLSNRTHSTRKADDFE